MIYHIDYNYALAKEPFFAYQATIAFALTIKCVYNFSC